MSENEKINGMKEPEQGIRPASNEELENVSGSAIGGLPVYFIKCPKCQKASFDIYSRRCFSCGYKE